MHLVQPRLCDVLRFQSLANQPDCQPHTVCVTGQDVAAQPTTSSDRQCRLCPAGYVDQDSDPETPCLPCAGTVGGTAAAPNASVTIGDFTLTFTQAVFDGPTVLTLTGTHNASLFYEVREKPAPPTGCAGLGGVYNPTGSSGAGCSPAAKGSCRVGDLSGKHADPGFNGGTDPTVSLNGATSVIGRSLVLLDGYQTGSVLACGTIVDGQLGTFQSASGKTSCDAVATCSAGQRESAAPTISTDRSCAPCAANSFQSEPDLRFCLSASACPVGLKVKDAHTATTDTVCEPVTCPGLGAPLYGNITACDGVQLFGATCTVACKNDRFVLGGTGVRTCVQSGVFEGQAASCSCDPVYYLDRSVADCVAVCPAETYGKGGVCTNCTKPCLKGVSFETQACDPATDTNRKCKACSGCPLGQFGSAGCEGTQDTICSDFQPCEADEYESAPGTASTDRVCTKCTVCDANEFAFTGCCKNQDTQCMPLTTCLPTEFQLTAPAPAVWGGFGSDRVCRVPAACTSTQYRTSASNSTQDVTCADCTRCTNGTYAKSRCTSVADTECVAWSPCKADEFIEVAGGPNSDTVCAACRQCGQHEVRVGGCGGSAQDTTCAPVHVCDPVTEYEAAPRNETHGPVCSACSTCADDEYLVTACHNDTDTQCAKTADRLPNELEGCPRGQHRLGDTPENSLCVDCNECISGVNFAAGGLTCPTGFKTPVCTPVSTCVVGQEVEATPPTAARDRVCRSCTACGPGMWQTAPCNATHDRVCAPWTACSPTQYESSPGDRESDRTCLPCSTCPEGETVSQECSGAHNVVCKPVRQCDTSQFRASPGTPTRDTVCSACPSTSHGRANVSYCPLVLLDVCAAPTTATTTVAPTTKSAVVPDTATGTKVSFSLQGDYAQVTDAFNAALKSWVAGVMGLVEALIQEFTTRSGSILVAFHVHDPTGATLATGGHADATRALEEYLTTAGAAFSFDGMVRRLPAVVCPRLGC